MYTSIYSTVENTYQEWYTENNTVQILVDNFIKQVKLERKKNEGKKHEKNYRKASTISPFL